MIIELTKRDADHVQWHGTWHQATWQDYHGAAYGEVAAVDMLMIQLATQTTRVLL